VSDLLDGSRVVSHVRRASRNSRVLGALREARTRLAIGGERSRLVGTVDRVGGTLGTWVRGSWLYGWLTAEPDPDIIVIDLRETYTVGPVIATLDRLAGWIGPRWRGSTPQQHLETAAEWLGHVGESSRAVRVLSALLVPPEFDTPNEPDEFDDEFGDGE
jgi:hypothetical protein